jgi:hypothetical protein
MGTIGTKDGQFSSLAGSLFSDWLVIEALEILPFPSPLHCCTKLDVYHRTMKCSMSPVGCREPHLAAVTQSRFENE